VYEELNQVLLNVLCNANALDDGEGGGGDDARDQASTTPR
jgi:hypothetical protein